MAVEDVSRIFELGYKKWQKRFKGTLYRVWTIAWTEALNAFKSSKIVKNLVGIRVMILIVGMFKLISVGFFNTTIMLTFASFGQMMSPNFLPFIADKTLFARMYAAILGTQFGFFDVVLIGFVGAGLIANDREYNSITLYLSRPVSRWEYILGKYGALFIYIATFTWVPTTLYFFSLEAILKRTFSQLATDLILFYIPTLVSGLINGLLISTLVLTLSSITKKARYVGMITGAINPLSMMLSQIMRDVLGIQLWYMFSIPIVLKIIQLWLIGIPPAHYYSRVSIIGDYVILPQINVGLCFLYVGIIIAVCLYILLRTIRKMEITE